MVCEKVQPLSSSPSFWGLVLQITSLRISSLELLNISHLKQNTAETFIFSFFWCWFWYCSVYEFKVTGLWIWSTYPFNQFYIKEWIAVSVRWGRTVGKKISGNRKTEKVLYMLQPRVCISDQEGLVVTFHDTPRPGIYISWVGDLPCSSEKEDRRGEVEAFTFRSPPLRPPNWTIRWLYLCCLNLKAHWWLKDECSNFPSSCPPCAPSRTAGREGGTTAPEKGPNGPFI